MMYSKAVRGLLATAVFSGTLIVAMPWASADDSSCSAGDPSASTCSAGATADASGPAALVGSPAPALSGRALVGKSDQLEQLLGKPTAVVFWLYTCPHCRDTMPIVNKLGSKDGRIVSVALGNNGKGPKGYETPKAAVRSMKLKMPTIQTGSDTFDDWHLQSVPTAVIVDSSGDVTAVVQFGDTGGPADFAQQVKSALAQAS